MRVFNRGKVSIDEMTFEQMAEDYCELAAISNATDAMLKEHRPRVLKEFEARNLKIFESNGRVLEVRNVVKKKINMEELEKVCKKKNVEIGSVYHIIHPKSGNIPAKVLETLDKYFTLETKLEVDVKDVEKAVGIGLITQKDSDKIIEKNETKSIYPKVKDEVNAKIIVD